jgi:hypothetical protein
MVLVMKISDDPPADDVGFEVGGKARFVNVVAESRGYQCEDCGRSALETPLFVDATATTKHPNNSRWFFFLKSAVLRCSFCGDGGGVEAGLPEEREELDRLAEALDADGASGPHNLSDDGSEDSTPLAPQTGGSNSGSTRPGTPSDRADDREGDDEDHHTHEGGAGLDDSVIPPTDPRRHQNGPVAGPRGDGKHIGEMATANETADTEGRVGPREVGREAARLTGIRDVGAGNTFLGRACTLAYRRVVLFGLGALLLAVLAVELAGLPVGSSVATVAVLVNQTVTSTVGWPLLGGIVLTVGYAGFLYDREQRGWPHAPQNSAVEPTREHRRLRIVAGAAAGLGAVAVGVGDVLAVPMAAPAVVVGIAGAASALQFRHLHAAKVLEAGIELPSGLLSAVVRGSVLLGAGAVVVAPSLTAALAGGILPAVVALAAGEWVDDAEDSSPLSRDVAQ